MCVQVCCCAWHWSDRKGWGSLLGPVSPARPPQSAHSSASCTLATALWARAEPSCPQPTGVVSPGVEGLGAGPCGALGRPGQAGGRWSPELLACQQRVSTGREGWRREPAGDNCDLLSGLGGKELLKWPLPRGRALQGPGSHSHTSPVLWGRQRLRCLPRGIGLWPRSEGPRGLSV